MQRIPLEERLRSAGASNSLCPATAWIFLDSFFKNLSEMSLDYTYNAFYDDAVLNGTYGDIQNTFVAQAVYEAMSGSYRPIVVPELLFQILIKPFADKNIFN